MSEYKETPNKQGIKILHFIDEELVYEEKTSSNIYGGIALTEKRRNHKQRNSYLRRGDSRPAFNRKLYLLEG